MKSYLTSIISAHTHCSNHRAAIINDTICGCFYCLKIFCPVNIEDWIEDEKDYTALCPYYGIDSVIGKSSGYPITKEFLTAMRKYWFNE